MLRLLFRDLRRLPSRGFSSLSPLATLGSYGIPEQKASDILAKFPRLLTSDLENTVTPKLDFLRGAGFTGADMTEILASNPRFLGSSLERTIAVSVRFLQSILPSKDAVVRVLKFTNLPLTPKSEANIQLLRDHGVPDAMLLKLLLSQPRALARSKEDFAFAVGKVRELGLDPTTAAFMDAVGVMSYMSRSTFLRKVELYRELGWDDESVYAMFKRHPQCLNVSDEGIRRKIGYFRETFGWGPELMSRYPVLMKLSMEKRIFPRRATLDALVSKGLVKANMGPTWFLLAERNFFEKYVKKYKNKAPEVVEAFLAGREFPDERPEGKKKKPMACKL